MSYSTRPSYSARTDRTLPLTCAPLWDTKLLPYLFSRLLTDTHSSDSRAWGHTAGSLHGGFPPSDICSQSCLTLFLTFTYLFSVCEYVYAGVREQLLEIGSLLPPCRFWKLNPVRLGSKRPYPLSHLSRHHQAPSFSISFPLGCPPSYCGVHDVPESQLVYSLP